MILFPSSSLVDPDDEHVVFCFSSDVGGEQIETRVSNMEREYQERYKDWSDAQKRLRDVAAELERLHEDMQLLKVSS